MALFPTNATQIQTFATALYGVQVGSTTLAQVNNDILSSGGLNNALNAYYTASFGTATTASVAQTIATNVGLGTDTNAVAFITAQLNAAAPAARGAAVIALLDNFLNTTTGTYATAATAFNATVATAVAYTGTANVAAGTANLVVAPAPSVFALTSGIDILTGTSGDDSFVANVANDNTGTATVETLTALDNITGGAGNDKLTYVTVGATAFPAATISGVETYKMISDGAATMDLSGTSFSGVNAAEVQATGDAVAVTGKSNLTSVIVTGTPTTVAVDDSGSATTTADKLTSVSVNGNTGAVTVGGIAAVDSFSTLSLANSASNATITATAGTRALTVNLDAVTGGTITDAEATSLVVNTTGTASSGFTLTEAKAKTVTLNDTVKTTIVDVNIAAATSLTVTGAGATKISATTTVTALTSIDSTGSTGGLTVTPAIGNSVTFVGGPGKDSVKIGATTKTISLGAGDDTVVINAVSALGGGSVNGGDGTDTLEFNTFANAVTASAGTTFAPTVTGFEKLKLSGVNAAAAAIDLDNLNAINYVTFSATNTETISLNNLGDAGTVAITASQTAAKPLTITMKNNTASDVLNLVLSKDTATATTEIVAANVETVNLTLTESDVAADGLAGNITHAATLTLANATSLIASGNAGATLGTISGTKFTNIDFSGQTASGALVSFTTDALTTASTIKGGAGANTIVASAATKAITYIGQDKVDTITINNGKDNAVNLGGGNDSYTGGTGNETINGGAGNDTIAAGTGADIITGGTGNDTITFVANANRGTYATLTDASAGDVLNFADLGTETFASTKITLAATASFSDYLDQATTGDGSAAAALGWFQYGGDTYVVEDKSADAAFVVGTDIIVKLSGLVELKNSTVGDHILTIV